MIGPDKERTERLYTADEAAHLLNINRRKVIAMGLAGDLEMVKLGARTLRFTSRSIQKLLRPARGGRHAD